jgi:hypothetical protein
MSEGNGGCNASIESLIKDENEPSEGAGLDSTLSTTSIVGI